MIAELFETAAATFAGLFPIVNPFSTAVVFISLTERFSAAKKEQQARWAALSMSAILFVCIGVQFVGLAVIEIASNEQVLEKIVSALRNVAARP